MGIDQYPILELEQLVGVFVCHGLHFRDTVSTLSGEVCDARRVFPKAMFLALSLTILSYILPMLIGVGLMKDGVSWLWQPGYYQSLAGEIGGSWLSTWMLLAATVAIIGQFQALLSSTAYGVLAMSECGWLPIAVGIRSSHGTPSLGITLSVLAVILQSGLGFMDIIKYLNVVYCIAQLLEFGAFLVIRYYHPMLKRPFRVPLGFKSCCVMLIPPTILMSTVMLLPFVERELNVIWFLISVVVGGNTLYLVVELMRYFKVADFRRQPPIHIDEFLTVYAH